MCLPTCTQSQAKMVITVTSALGRRFRNLKYLEIKALAIVLRTIAIAIVVKKSIEYAIIDP